MTAAAQVPTISINNKLGGPQMRQITIEPPLNQNSECVVLSQVPLSDCPMRGARLKLKSFGVCFRRFRSALTSSADAMPSNASNFDRKSSTAEFSNPPSASEIQPVGIQRKPLDPSTFHIPGVKDCALFSGFEVAAVIDKIGEEVETNMKNFKAGDRVILYPYEEAFNAYSDYIIEPDLSHLVRIPDDLSFNVAALLPTSGLLGITAARKAIEIIQNQEETSSDTGEVPTYRILIIGAGGLALWVQRFIQHTFNKSKFKDRYVVCFACLNAEGMERVKGIENVKAVRWEESEGVCDRTYEEKDIVSRTLIGLGGPADVVINFGTVCRSLLRSLRCARDGATVLINEEFNSVLLPKFVELGNKTKINICPVAFGSFDLLCDLVKLVASKEVPPPPYEVFEFEDVQKAISMLCLSQINGRAVIDLTEKN